MPEILFFPYFGPNRHSDKRVVELRLDFGSDEGTEFPQQVSDIRQLLIEAGVLDEAEQFPGQALPDDRQSWYSSLLVQTALLFQIKNGHRVGLVSVHCDPLDKRCIALMEHEDSETGMTAIKLAVEMFSGKMESLPEAYRRFSDFARERVLPFETEAIIDAAKQRNIPFFQLERAPLTGCINTGFRIRRNGLLNLGYGVNSCILDGTFCVDRAGDYLNALIKNPSQREAILRQLGIPVVQAGEERLADARPFHLLVINGKVTAVCDMVKGDRKLVENVHDSLIESALSVSEKAGSEPLVLTLLAVNIAQPLTQTGGVAVGFELAPDLYELLSPCPEGKDLVASAAGDLIDWLYPEKTSARIPMVAVTGTNGKTTTSRMIRHIFQNSGLKPGLVCTDGIFLDQKQVSKADNSTFMGHARVLTSKQVDAAVLETHHRGIAVHGFAFQNCDVAVCLNVTEEHLAEGEIETVEEMAGIKRALVERASHAAVLFADDSHCPAMLGHIKSDTVCLVSLQSDVNQLAELVGQKSACFCLLETVRNEEWIILYNKGQRSPVMPVADIPATFMGTARVNVSNAMHAVVASYFSGIDIGLIRSALSGFGAGQELTPGRLNVFDDFPFRVIMDFAHNPDGMKKLCEFADLQNVRGRKVVAFAGLSKRTDEINRKIAQAVAGHFDFYFCKDYEPSEPPKRRFTGPFMQKVLIEEGVPGHATTVVTFGQDVIFKIFDSCEPGDLLLLLVGHAETGKIPRYIQAYKHQR